jgi:hypothetical protein
MRAAVPFPQKPNARADLKPGALYAIDGGDGFVYFGQVASRGDFGFFRYRSHTVSAAEPLLAPVMSRFLVHHPTVRGALRLGIWLKVGRFEVRKELTEDPILVQWPVGTLTVNLWKGSKLIGTKQAHDPEIQDLEVMSAYDAISHVPERLRADFDRPADAWRVGGSVWRERRKKEHLASANPQQAWHQLPKNWVRVEGEA